jgi:NAD(P)-dependent dehydrogenase (short-subunit alcohol dehydrogenase family)
MGKLEGKIALVTGGNGGIGLATAKQCVNEGAYVFITGRREQELAAAVKEIGRNVKDRRIRVNAISPGSIDTPGLSDLLASAEVDEERKKMISASVPLGRFGTREEIAKAVVFLASDDSSYITGTELFVDGGFAQV